MRADRARREANLLPISEWVDAVISDEQLVRLESYFGPLELNIMDVVWDEGPATVNDVLEHLNRSPGKSYVYNTVMTTLARLADKGYLDRTRDGRAYVYSATSREQFLQDRFAEETRKGLEELGDIGVAGLHDGMDEDAMAKLRRLADGDAD